MTVPLAATPLRAALDPAAQLVPKLLGFLAILLVGWATAVLLRRVVHTLLAKAGLAAVLDKAGVRTGPDPALVAARIVYWAILLVTLTLACGVFGENPLAILLASVVAFLPKAAAAAVIVLVAVGAARLVRGLVTRSLAGLSYARPVANTAGGSVLGLGIIAALGQVGVATTVTMPVLVAVLATAGGILVVGAGGGLVRPMQRRWDRWLDAAERETRAIGDTVHDNARQENARHENAPHENLRHSTRPGNSPADASPPVSPATDLPAWASDMDAPTEQFPAIR
ncbi:MAG: CmpX [Actinomycetia bacterium]|nr:CmpX [Actinomycetes bacterium]